MNPLLIIGLCVLIFAAGIAAGAVLMLARHPDTARIEWLRENCTSVSDGYNEDGSLSPPWESTHRRVGILARDLPTVPRETKDWTRAAIDRAIAEARDAPGQRHECLVEQFSES